MRTRLTAGIGALLIAATPTLAANGKTSLDLSLPLAMLAGTDGTLTLTCDATEDSETRGMMAALQRGTRRTWESRDDDSRVTAVRRGSKFRLRAWEGGAKKLDLELPWKVAECLFGGRNGESVEVDVDSIQAQGGLALLLSGETAELGISLD